MHVSNALLQSGFILEAERYINRSLQYDPGNLYSEYLRAFILYARDQDLLQTKELLIEALNKDLTRYDIIQEIAKICYYMRDYPSAYIYYKKLIDIKESMDLDIYKFENAKIGVVFSEIGLTEESELYLNTYKNDAENDESMYKQLSLAMYYSYMGEPDQAMDQLKQFSQQENIMYLLVPFLKIDPLADNIRNLPEFKRLMDELESKVWSRHQRLEITLEEKGLLRE